MKMYPFSLKTIYTVLILVMIYFFLDFLPNSNIAFVDIIWKLLAILIIFIPSMLYLNLSEDITLFIKELKAKLLS